MEDGGSHGWSAADAQAPTITHAGSVATSDPATRRLVALRPVSEDRYRVRGQLAQGGMGRILAADDLTCAREVAIKEMLASDPNAELRFRREATITARLQHPAIVPVYDIGRLPAGSPFFAMKLVNGKPLHEVIDRASSLGERLALLPNVLAVADAIGYAHQQGVVHRDLKPANILVGAFGETVVIDWGLAKELSDRDDDVARLRGDSSAELTTAGSVMGTPAYMAPEQARGEPIDERADVYALGSMLYHVLTGDRPFTGDSSQAVLDKLLSGPPRPLAQRAPDLPADLVTIVDTAMARDPERRYRTAVELADELRRFHTGQLVAAHRYTLFDLARRWIRRHRLTVVVAAALLAVLIAGGTIAVRQIVRERDHAEALRDRAERERAAAENLIDFMLSDLSQRLEAVARLELLEGVGAKVVAYYRELAASDPLRQSAALDLLGDARRDKDDQQRALAAYREALALRQRAGDAGVAELADSYLKIARVERDSDLPAAAALYRKAQANAERRLRTSPDDPDASRQLAASHEGQGFCAMQQGNLDAALAAYRRAREIRQRLAEATPKDDRARRDLFDVTGEIGTVYFLKHDVDHSAEYYDRARAIIEALVARDPEHARWRADLSDALVSRGEIDWLRKDLPAALATHRRALAIIEALVEEDPLNAEWQYRATMAHFKVGNILLHTGDLDGALAHYQSARAILLRLVKRDPGNGRLQRQLFIAHGKVGVALEDRGDWSGALAAHRAALAIAERLAAADQTSAEWQSDHAFGLYSVGNVLARTRAKRGEARALVDQAFEILDRLHRAKRTTAMDDRLLEDVTALRDRLAR